MTDLHRYTVNWTAGSGGPGTSTFHARMVSSSDHQAWVNSIRTMFNSLVTFLPTDVTLTFPGELEVIEEETNTLISIDAVTPPASVTGTSTASYSAASGARMRWLTSTIFNGRRITGTTFLVPLSTGVYETDGTLTSSFITNAQAAMTTFLASSTGWVQKVYHRPTAASPSSGASATVTGASIPDKVAVLRSRRD